MGPARRLPLPGLGAAGLGIIFNPRPISEQTSTPSSYLPAGFPPRLDRHLQERAFVGSGHIETTSEAIFDFLIYHRVACA